MRAKVLVIIPTLNKFPEKTIKSIISQTIKPTRIIIATGSRKVLEECLRRGFDSVYLRPNLSEHVGIRMTKAMNFALKSLKLEDYDYILKVDDDVVLHPRFIEASILTGADCVGGSGRVISCKYIH
ncbi:MAG: glycosyltransferase family 2 protein [Candidatus Methanomethyliaceae archaeon]|nr:glycosyltransferase family 2 protein [Candidatus Methanomethyliaceae archaeon]